MVFSFFYTGHSSLYCGKICGIFVMMYWSTGVDDVVITVISIYAILLLFISENWDYYRVSSCFPQRLVTVQRVWVCSTVFGKHSKYFIALFIIYPFMTCWANKPRACARAVVICCFTVPDKGNTFTDVKGYSFVFSALHSFPRKASAYSRVLRCQSLWTWQFVWIFL